jgi:hypothetical protein
MITSARQRSSIPRAVEVVVVVVVVVVVLKGAMVNLKARPRVCRVFAHDLRLSGGSI